MAEALIFAGFAGLITSVLLMVFAAVAIFLHRRQWPYVADAELEE